MVPLYFSFYILLVVIGVLNILTGVFVSRAAEASALDKDLVAHAEIANTRNMVRDLHKMLQEIDVEHSGIVHVDQLRDYIANEDVQAYMSVLHLDSVDCHRMISLMHQEANGNVSMQEFIALCLRYSGNARSVEIAVVLREQSKQNARLHHLAEKAEEFMQELSAKAEHLLGRPHREI